MFFSLSKTITKFGGFRIGIGTRFSKKNAPFFLIILLFYAVFILMWYMMIFCGWVIYAVCYGIYWMIKRIINLMKIKGGRK